MKFYFTILITGLIVSCTSIDGMKMNTKEYLAWYASSGLIKKKNAKNIQIEVRYLPSEFLAYKEVRDNIVDDKSSVTVYDSLNNVYAKAIYFDLKINAIEDTNLNLLQTDISSYEDYKTRIDYLNFHIEDFIYLTINGKKQEPILTHLESFNELSRQLIFHLAFISEIDHIKDDVRLTFTDPYWRSGVNHFIFSKDDINRLPELIIE